MNIAALRVRASIVAAFDNNEASARISIIASALARSLEVSFTVGGASQATLELHGSRLARGLAWIVNVLDPDVIVLGGGLSQLGHLYARLPELMAPHVFSDHVVVTIRPPRWGDAGGVRGAAWLWD